MAKGLVGEIQCSHSVGGKTRTVSPSWQELIQVASTYATGCPGESFEDNEIYIGKRVSIKLFPMLYDRCGLL